MLDQLSWENLDAFFDTDDFAIVGTFQYKTDRADLHDAGEDWTQNVIFEEPTSVSDFGQFAVTATNPSVWTKYTPAVAALIREDTLTFTRGDTVIKYIIESPPKNDGTGVARIFLIADKTQDDKGGDLGDPFGS